MIASQVFKYVLIVIALLVVNNHAATAFNDPSFNFHVEEREALLALKTTFNHQVLDQSWKSNNAPQWYGIQCSNGRVTEIVLENLGLTGEIKVDALVNLTALSVLSLKNNSISGKLLDFSYNKRLRSIDLSDNKFSGKISASLSTLRYLESLQLQNNNLSGSIPSFQQSILKFNVSNNHLSVPVRNAESLEYLISYSRNDVSDSASSQGGRRLSGDNESGNRKKYHYAFILAVIDVIGLIVIAILFFIYYKKNMRLKEAMRRLNLIQNGEENQEKVIDDKGKGVANSEDHQDRDKGELKFMEGVASFELADLLKASAEGLGKGNFGNSYKATLDDGRAVVVKRLRDLKPLSSDEFTKQVIGIAELKHPNLLPLLGYYYSKHEKFLVFKFAANGNLYNRLHGGRGTRNRITFPWSSRLATARAVAKGLEFLHLNPNSPTVPHANLKSTNILLDENDMVLISDYGLTSIIASPIAAQRMVSFKSPEFQTSKRVSKRSDIWSFGALVLELITGKVSIHSAPPEANGIDLCNWVHRAVREEWTAEIFDGEISVQRSAYSGMLGLLQMAMRCCDKVPEKRPNISELVRELENVKSVIDSEEDEDYSMDRSYTDESLSEKSIIIGDER